MSRIPSQPQHTPPPTGQPTVRLPARAVVPPAATPPPAAPLPQVPPPASQIPGITTGAPPLPVGEVVSTVNLDKLTPMERQHLERVGWQRGQPLAPNQLTQARAVAAAAVAESVESLPPPVDPSTPAVTMPPLVDANTLAASQQAQVRSILASAMGGTAPAPAAQVPQTRPAVQPQPVVQVPQVTQVQPAPPPAEPPPAPVQDFTPPPVTHDHKDETGVTGAAQTCPHCNWDLSRPDIPEPAAEERQQFLVALLGQKPFSKTYSRFDGNVRVTFRTLSLHEVDACWQQASRELKAGEIGSDPLMFVERINRLRMLLQLQRLQLGSTTDIVLADGLSRAANPNATSYWFPEESAGVAPDLKPIQDVIYASVLTNETLVRMVYQQMTEFNRLTSKLEAMADAPDGFWSATG